jgi:endoribonuclease Dicer
MAASDVNAGNVVTGLRPRRYQEEVFEQARKENVIAALETGSGKTYISVLLLKWISMLESSQGKAIIFLAPRVALVQQQGDFIANHCALRVIKLAGTEDGDMSDRARWKRIFRHHDVLVMTRKGNPRSNNKIH